MSESGTHLLSAAQAERRAALRVVRRQALAALLTMGLLMPWGIGTALSALAGGSVGVVATSLFAWVLFRHPEGTSAARVAWSFYLGQALKAGLTIGLLASIFRSHVPAPWAVLVGYLVTHVAYWTAPKGPASRWIR